MVSWSDLSSAIHKNTHATFCIPHITLRANTCPVPNIVRHTVSLAPPAPPAPVPVTAPPAPAPAPAPAPTPAPAPRTIPPSPKKSSSPSNTISIDTKVDALPFHVKIPKAGKTCIDPIVLGIEHIDPLYLSAPRLTKHQMDIAEAQRLEAMMSDVYSKESGRSRGWTKSGLEHMLKARCASGGDIKELERARVSFPWKLIRDDKQASAFMDFICICKQIRVAVWDMDAKIVALYPAADPVAVKKDSYPLYQVNIQGEQMFGSQDLLKLCDSNKFVLMPPLSVLKSLSGLTLEELGKVATQLGMPAGAEGNKAERVAAIASYKVRARLLSTS